MSDRAELRALVLRAAPAVLDGYADAIAAAFAEHVAEVRRAECLRVAGLISRHRDTSHGRYGPSVHYLDGLTDAVCIARLASDEVTP